MKYASVKVILMAALAVVVIPSAKVMAEGTLNPIEYDYRRTLEFMSPYREYYRPSSFEYIDTMTGIPHLAFADVTIGSDGGYGFSIIRRSDPTATDDFMYTLLGRESATPYGLNWEVMNERIVFHYSSFYDFETRPEYIRDILHAYLLTQGGELYHFNACEGTGCAWRGDYWEIVTPQDNYPYPAGSTVQARQELYFSDNNWRIEAISKNIAKAEGWSTPFIQTEARLFLPDGTKKTYKLTSGHIPPPWEPVRLKLVEVDYPNGSKVTIDYLEEDKEAIYGFYNMPEKVTLEGAGNTIYKVDFKYEDVSSQISQYNNIECMNGNTLVCRKTNRPAGKLKRLEVSQNETLLYSRYYIYHVVPESFYTPLYDNDVPLHHVGPSDYQLVDTFVLDQAAVVEFGNSIPTDLDPDIVSDHWHFEPATFYGVGDNGYCDCVSYCGDRQIEYCFSDEQCLGGDVVISCYIGDVKRIVSPWSADVSYSYTVVEYDPQILYGNSYFPTIEIWNSAYQRYETNYIRTGTETYARARFDAFSAMKRVGTGDQAGTLKTTIEIDKLMDGDDPHILRCFADYVPGETDIKNHFHSVKKEYYYYDTPSINENGSIWRVHLLKALKTFGVRDGGDSFSLSDVEYNWIGLPSPFLHGIRLISDNSSSSTPYHVYYDRDVGGLSRHFIDPTPTIPAISSVQIIRDGVTYHMEASDFNIYNSPGKVLSYMDGGGGYSRTSNYKFSHEAQVSGDTYMIGVTTNADSSLNGGAGNLGTYRTDMTNGLLQASVVDMSALSLEYDSGGNVTNATGDDSVKNAYEDYVNGRPQTVKLYDEALTGDLTYNALGQATQITVPNAGGDELSYQYVYDNVGRLKSIIRPGDIEDTEITYLAGTSTTDGPSQGNLNHFYYAKQRKSVTGGRELTEYLDGWGRTWKTEVETDDGYTLAQFVERDLCGAPRNIFSPVTSENIDDNSYPIGALSISAHDAFGRPAFSTDQTGESGKFGRYVTYEYGAAGSSGLEVDITVDCVSGSYLCKHETYATSYKEIYKGPSPGELYMTEREGPIVSGGPTPRKFKYNYGSKGELLSISEESGAGIGDREFTYDAKGNVIGTYSPESGQRRFTRDSRGRITSIRASDNAVVNMTYDRADRVTQIQAVGVNQPLYKFTYHSGSGSLTKEEGDWNQVSYDIDYDYNNSAPLLDEVSIHYTIPTSMGVNYADFDIKYDYNEYGEITSSDYDGDMTITLTRDLLGRVVSIAKSGSDDIMDAIEYQPDGSLKRLSYGNDVVTDIYQLYGLGVITQIDIRTLAQSPDRSDVANDIMLINPAGAYAYWREQYGYNYFNGTFLNFDNYLNPLNAKIGPYGAPALKINASYDKEQHLSDVSYFAGNTTVEPFLHVAYGFDRRGNRESKDLTWDPGSSESYHYYYDNLNRLSSVEAGDTSTDGPTIGDYVHDSRGNVIQTPTHKYGFDLFDRLVDADDGKVKIYYTAGGNKFLKVTEEEATVYFYDPGGRMLCEKTFRLSDFRLISRKLYVYANGQMVAQF